MSITPVQPVRTDRRAVIALGILALALGTLQTVVDPALPLLQRELGVSPAEGALVGNALLVTGAAIAPIAGKLGDRYGGKRVLMRLMVAVSAGGLLSSLAPNLPVLLVGQVLQGAMVGAMPLSFILVRKHFTTGESQVAIGVVTALFTGGGMIGTLVAGPIAAVLSWHAMFAVPTVVIVAATVFLVREMPDDQPVATTSRIDWPGAFLLSATLCAFMVGFVLATSGGLSLLGQLAIVLVVVGLAIAWVRVERRSSSPMVDLQMLAQPVMWRAGVLTLVITVVLGMVNFLVPQLLAAPAEGYGFGAGTTMIGLLLLPAAIAGSLSDSVGGFATRRFGPRTVVVVAAVVTAAVMFMLAAVHAQAWQVALVKVVVAAAAGLASTALLASTATSVDAEDTGIATSLLVVARVVGVAAGAQIGGAVLAAGGGGVPHEAAFVIGFVLAGVVAASAVLVYRFTKKETHA